jgi:hypothetical protein
MRIRARSTRNMSKGWNRRNSRMLSLLWRLERSGFEWGAVFGDRRLPDFQRSFREHRRAKDDDGILDDDCSGVNMGYLRILHNIGDHGFRLRAQVFEGLTWSLKAVARFRSCPTFCQAERREVA